MKIGLGVDVGGTFAKLVAVEPRGRPLYQTQVPTEPGRGPRSFIRRLLGQIRSAELELGRKFEAVGLGVAGDVDPEKGVLRYAPNLKDWSGFSFKASLGDKLHRPLVVENDANMAAWGGFALELGKRPKTMVAITLGTGVGGGIIVDRKLYRGATGSAGEIGHMRVEPRGELCHCGSRGCLEAYAGSYGIVRSVRKLLGPGRKGSILKSLCPDLDGLTPSTIALAAEKGDPVAQAAWIRTGYYLGLGIVNLVYCFNPEAVLIVGGVSKAGPLLLKPLTEVLQSQPFRTPFRKVSVRIARRSDLGALGAALLALEESG